MQKTSFGKISRFYNGSELEYEYLEFEQSGRFHEHDVFEVVKVIKGSGRIETEEEFIEIFEGNSYIIPPKTSHRMIPNREMSLIVTYRSEV